MFSSVLTVAAYVDAQTRQALAPWTGFQPMLPEGAIPPSRVRPGPAVKCIRPGPRDHTEYSYIQCSLRRTGLINCRPDLAEGSSDDHAWKSVV